MFFTIFSDYPENIAKALRRADAYYHKNEMANTFCIKSRNSEAPLTEDEKRRISDYLKSSGFSYEIIFE